MCIPEIDFYWVRYGQFSGWMYEMKMKNNLFPVAVNDIKQLFWTGNGETEIECTISELSERQFVVKTDAKLPQPGSQGIFWRPFFPIFSASVIDVGEGMFIAELGALDEAARKMLETLLAAQQGQQIPNRHRPGLLFRIILKALFNLEQSLPQIHRRTFLPAEFPWSLAFEKEWPAICNEVRNIFDHVDVSEIPLGPDKLANWHSVLVAEKGQATVQAKKLLPCTAKLVESVPSMLNADLSILRPGTVIGYHKANSRTFLRMHLGIIIPTGDVCLQLEDQKLSWENGKVMIFDDFYPHSAWNKTEETRVILMVDFLRPMPGWKEAFIRFLHRKTASPLPNVPAKWLDW